VSLSITAETLYKVTQTVQLSGNEMLNRKVLSSRRKVETVRRETGGVFHNRAAATGNARSPRLDRLVAGTNNRERLQQAPACSYSIQR